MSVVRERFCQTSNDVLYDCKSKNHYFHYGIVSFKVENINGKEFSRSNVPDKYKLKLEHKPEFCVYPHVEIKVLKNDIPAEKVNPPSIKTEMRLYYKSICTIHKLP